VEQIKDLLNRLPIFLFLGVYLVTVACDMKEFLEETAASPLQQKKEEVKSLETQVTSLRQKLKAAEIFEKEYKERLTALKERAQELRGKKNTLTDSIRQEEVLSIISKVARKSGIKQLSLRPNPEKTNTFYFEKPFTLQFEGFYAQLMVFLKNLSEEEKIFKVDNYNITPVGGQAGRFIKLKGQMEIKVYWYNPSKADKIGSELET